MGFPSLAGISLALYFCGPAIGGKKDENYAGERIAYPNGQQFIYIFICILQSPDYYNHIGLVWVDRQRPKIRS